MQEHFELLDIYKAFISLIAGLILGLEREMKDKSAGLKTITIICLGSTLFSIISYKLAGNGDPTRVASYIVSGIGFLGAGVIFKEGFSVYGLTTAGIIWIAAAIGMSIGFGEIYIAFTFLICALIVIYVAKFFTSQFVSYHHNKILKFKIPVSSVDQKKSIISDIKQISKVAYEIALEREDEFLLVTLDLHINNQQIETMESYLINNENIVSFSY
ncbi:MULTISPECIES: MgtC/SapB family protein [unclassified Kaistella]|uniref:MgtC/SapB family protein n=1 Tax=unclassified Kaistella TaxID=2762626 RepID=UPI00273232DA|nr:MULTISPECIES: MgtC/SapB family protein [unclassified Kaistella]MDP2453308.1 MgtC/SapB family protein [Kaistella sp. SH11-4b]MDP2456365.1 MgtC/SapB family protein [Kaistella sp. SH40-3]MDP2459121.1 MgtC/SapB family protein [Kaistella sp. SH19-2b]